MILLFIVRLFEALLFAVITVLITVLITGGFINSVPYECGSWPGRMYMARPRPEWQKKKQEDESSWLVGQNRCH